MIHFTKHAKDKFKILARHGVFINEEKIKEIVLHPDALDTTSRFPLIIAQSKLDNTHVLRVIYKQEDNLKTIITFYPGRIKQYAQYP